MGCGVGDIAGMIKTGNLNGKCADLNALYVGLARSVGLPARDVYGIRVAPSEFGYKCAGRRVGQRHQGAALPRRGVARRTAAGRRSIRPTCARSCSRSRRPISQERSQGRRRAQGAVRPWEGNWVAYNDGHDIKLPGSRQAPIGFLMYPQAENRAGPLDSLDPDKFKYTITSKELTS